MKDRVVKLAIIKVKREFGLRTLRRYEAFSNGVKESVIEYLGRMQVSRSVNLALEEVASNIMSKMLMRQFKIRQIRKKTINTLAIRGVWDI